MQQLRNITTRPFLQSDLPLLAEVILIVCSFSTELVFLLKSNIGLLILKKKKVLKKDFLCRPYVLTIYWLYEPLWPIGTVLFKGLLPQAFARDVLVEFTILMAAHVSSAACLWGTFHCAKASSSSRCWSFLQSVLPSSQISRAINFYLCSKLLLPSESDLREPFADWLSGNFATHKLTHDEARYMPAYYIHTQSYNLFLCKVEINLSFDYWAIWYVGLLIYDDMVCYV